LGKEVSARIYIPRNIKFIRKYFAMLKTALEMADVEMNDDQWRHLVLCGIGHCDWFKYGDKQIPIPKSISFANMEEAEFELIYSDSLTFICANYVDDSPESLDQMMQFM
jgi:hypothetical protein